MAASGNWNAQGEWDAREAAFSFEELEAAADLRQRVSPTPGLDRKDRCPHTPMCGDIGTCIEAIAWYRRHQHVIEGQWA